MKLVFRKPYLIHSYEVDPRGCAHLGSLLNFLQDAAGFHAASLGVALKDLAPKRMTWVLSRYHIEVLRYPALGETMHVETWPSSWEGMFALRDFDIKDDQGQTVLRATSSWLVIDIQTKKLIPLAGLLSAIPTLDRRAVEDDFLPLPELKRADKEETFRVLLRDLDLNRHVNNTVYIQWALETVMEKTAQNRKPVKVEVGYKAEAFFGEKIRSRTQQTDPDGKIFVHQISSLEGGKELARLKTLWA